MSKRKKKTSGTDNILKYAGIAFIIYLAAGKLFSSVSARINFLRPRLNLGPVNFKFGIPQSVLATLTIPIENNNPVGFPIDGLLGVIKYGNYELSEFTLVRPVTIAAGEVTELEFETFLNFGQLAANVVELVTNRDFLQQLSIAGTVYSAGINIPFNNPITIG